MNTNKWGPSAWIFTHTIVANAPEYLTEKQQEYYKNFFMDLKNILPCSYCRDSYTQILEVYPIDNYLHKGYLLRWWWYNVHNYVNQKLNKPKGYAPPFEEVLKKYDNFKAKKN